jgi:hypothetical protein
MGVDVLAIIGKISKKQEVVETQTRAPIHGWLYDALGRSYRVLYRVVETQIDGGGPVLASNIPHTFKPTPGYPTIFQARSLERAAEKQKISRIAKSMDPMRLLTPHADPTSGAPVVWLSHGESKSIPGQLYVLGGNGRVIGLMMTDEEAYQIYEKMGRAMWPEIWPTRPARKGSRHILVRQVFASWCSRRDMDAQQSNPDSRLSMTEATELAGATQSSLAAKETPMGEALSLVRSLGLDMHSLARQMPTFRWDGAIARDNVYEFLQENRSFGDWLSRLMGAEAWSSWTGDPDNTARLINATMIGFLPQSVVNEGFGSDREEKALLSALPILVQISVLADRGEIEREWDLVRHIESAREVLKSIRKLSFKATMAEIDRMANQETLNLVDKSGQPIVHPTDKIEAEGILLGIVLKRGEQARDPSIPVEQTLKRYLEIVQQVGQGDRQGGFGAMMGGPRTDPETALGKALGESLRGKGGEPVRVRTRQRASRSLFG